MSIQGEKGAELWETVKSANPPRVLLDFQHRIRLQANHPKICEEKIRTVGQGDVIDGKHDTGRSPPLNYPHRLL